MNDQQLIEQCIKHDAKAQKTLYEIYAPLMMSVCVRYVKDRDVAQDVLQEGFIKVFTRISTYTGIGQFGGWIRRIFVTTALQYLRDNKYLNYNTSINAYEETISNADHSILDSISADHLLTCITDLPDGYRTVFNLFAVEGYSHKEIGGMLSIEESTSRSQYQRARKALQKSLESLNAQENAR